jgi:hypothetical protein
MSLAVPRLSRPSYRGVGTGTAAADRQPCETEPRAAPLATAVPRLSRPPYNGVGTGTAARTNRGAAEDEIEGAIGDAAPAVGQARDLRALLADLRRRMPSPTATTTAGNGQPPPAAAPIGTTNGEAAGAAATPGVLAGVPRPRHWSSFSRSQKHRWSGRNKWNGEHDE